MDKYKQAEDNEKIEFAKYESEIDEYINGNRGKVTLTEEEYAMFKSQFSKNKNTSTVSINKPNTWIINTEYDFGDGVYGQRFTGSFTAEANNSTNAKCLQTIPITDIDCLISVGGYWVINSSTSGKSNFCTANVSMGSNSTGFRCSEVYILNENLAVYTSSTYDRTNAPYDLWVLYTKKQTN